MFPGLTTRLSEELTASSTTISPKNDMVRLTGSTAVATIAPSYAGFSGILFVVPVDGTIVTVTTGNIPVAVIMAQNQVTVFVFNHVTGKFYPGAIS